MEFLDGVNSLVSGLGSWYFNVKNGAVAMRHTSFSDTVIACFEFCYLLLSSAKAKRIAKCASEYRGASVFLVSALLSALHSLPFLGLCVVHGPAP